MRLLNQRVEAYLNHGLGRNMEHDSEKTQKRRNKRKKIIISIAYSFAILIIFSLVFIMTNPSPISTLQKLNPFSFSPELKASEHTIPPTLNWTQPPTPSNETTFPEGIIIMNISINETNLTEVVYNWNGTNFTVLNDSVVAYYNLDNVGALGEATGNVYDITDKGNNCTNSGSIVVAGQYGNARDFDGGNDELDCGSGSSIDNIFIGGGSFSMWFNPDSDGEGSQGRILHKRADTSSGWLLDGRNEAGGNLRLLFLRDFSTTDGGWQTAVNIPINTWTHVVVTYDEGLTTNNPIMYVNGVQLTVGSGLTELVTPVGSAVSDAAQVLTIGNRPNGERTYDGTIDEVIFLDRILTSDEAKQLYMNNLYKFDSDRWALYVNETGVPGDTLPDGDYNATVYARDNATNIDSTATRFWTIGIAEDVDTLSPNITFVLPTETDQFNHTVGSIDVNVSVQDDFNITNTTINLYFSNGTLVNSTTNISTIEHFILNFTGLDDGIYHFNASVFDNSSNENTTETRVVRIDSTPPNVTLENVTMFTDILLIPIMDVNATDFIMGVDVYYINWTDTFEMNDTNGSLINISALFEGEYWIAVNVNDTLNNTNSSFILLVNVTNGTVDDVDTLSPNITFVVPTEINDTNFTVGSIDVNVSVMDDFNITNITIELFFENGTLVNSTTNDSTQELESSFILNFTGLDDGIYHFNATTVDNSSNVNTTETRVIRIDSTAPDVELSNISFLTNESEIPIIDVNATDVIMGVDVYHINWTDTFEMNDTNGSLINISALFEGEYWIQVNVNDTLNNTNSSFILLVNVTNATLPIVITNTSLEGVELNITNFTIDSSTFIRVDEEDFNTTLPNTEFVLSGIFNYVKITGGQSNDIFIRILEDEVVIHEELVGHVENKNIHRISTTHAIKFNVSNGEHNLSIEFRRDGNGAIEFNAVHFILIEELSSDNSIVLNNDTEQEIIISDTDFQPVFNFSIQQNSSNGIFVSIRGLANSTTDMNNITFYINNTDTFDTSIKIEGSFTNALDLASIALFHYDNSSLNVGLNNYSLMANMVSGNITYDFTEFTTNLADVEDRRINTHIISNDSSDFDTTSLTIGGDEWIAIANTTARKYAGTETLIYYTMTVLSTSGLQDVEVKVNVSGSPDGCEFYKDKTVDDGEVKTIFDANECSDLTVGNDYEYVLWTSTQSGEEFHVLDEDMIIIDSNPFDIAELDVAPIVAILQPENGTTINGTILLNVTIVDENGDLFLHNITISNTTFTYNVTTNLGSTIENYSWDTTEVQNGLYNLTWSAYENETVQGLVGNDTHTVNISNLIVDSIPPDINFVTPTLANDTNTTNDYIEINVTASDETGLSTINISTYYSNGTLFNYTLETTSPLYINLTIAEDGIYFYNASANDTSGNVNTTNTSKITIDRTAPTFDNLDPQTELNNNSFNYDIDATDVFFEVDIFTINDTYGGLWTINEDSGVVTNSSTLIDSFQEYWFLVGVNDTLGNVNNTALWLINITNGTQIDNPPVITAINFTNDVNTSFTGTIIATDDVGISVWSLNDTTIFNISQTGSLINITNISTVEIYWLTLTVNDTANQNSTMNFFVNITEPPIILQPFGNITILGLNEKLRRIIKLLTP